MVIVVLGVILFIKKKFAEVEAPAANHRPYKKEGGASLLPNKEPREEDDE